MSLALLLFYSFKVFACQEGAIALSSKLDEFMKHDELVARLPKPMQTKYSSYPKNPMREGLGDLSDAEVGSINNFVKETEVPVVVVGSSTIGRRRGLGTLDRIGHGPGSKSDIDYVIPSNQREVQDFFDAGFRSVNDLPQTKLPSYDRFQGLGFGTPSEDTYRIWFQPGKDPIYLKPGEKNLPMFKVDLDPPVDPFKNLKFKEKKVMTDDFWVADGYNGMDKKGYVRFSTLDTTKGLKNHQGYDLDEPHVYIEMVRGDPAKPGLGKWLMDKVSERYPNHSIVSELAIKNESAVRQAMLAVRKSNIDLSDTKAIEKLFGDIPAVKVAKGPYKIVPKYTEDGGLDHFLIVRKPASKSGPQFEGFGEYARDPRFQKWMEGLENRPPAFFETQIIKNRIK